MLGIAGRSTVAFFYALALLRLAGRKSLSKLNFFDFLLANLMGNILGYYVTGTAKGARLFMAPAVFVTSGILSEVLTLKSRTARKILEGQPLMLVKNGKIIEKNMAGACYDIADVLMSLRKKDVFSLGEIEFAVLEPNGAISVQKKSQYRPVTPKDLKLPTGYEGLSTVLISDGQVLGQNLKTNKLDRAWLMKTLKNRGIEDVKKVFLACLATDGSLYVDLMRNVSPADSNNSFEYSGKKVVN